MQSFFFYFLENPTALYLAVGLISLCIGSFLNVVIFRTPKMMEQQWQQECQMLLHPEQPIIDQSKLTLSHHLPQCHLPNVAFQSEAFVLQ